MNSSLSTSRNLFVSSAHSVIMTLKNTKTHEAFLLLPITYNADNNAIKTHFDDPLLTAELSALNKSLSAPSPEQIYAINRNYRAWLIFTRCAGTAAFMNRDLAKAIKFYTYGIDAFRRADPWVRAEHYVEVRRLYRDRIRECIVAKRYMEALEDVAVMIGSTEEPRGVLYTIKALCLQRMGRMNEAKEVIIEGLRIDPWSVFYPAVFLILKVIKDWEEGKV